MFVFYIIPLFRETVLTLPIKLEQQSGRFGNAVLFIVNLAALLELHFYERRASTD